MNRAFSAQRGFGPSLHSSFSSGSTLGNRLISALTLKGLYQTVAIVATVPRFEYRTILRGRIGKSAHLGFVAYNLVLATAWALIPRPIGNPERIPYRPTG
jgi:hypothetical protein